MHIKIITDFLKVRLITDKLKKTHKDFFIQERQKQMTSIFLQNNLKIIRSNKKNEAINTIRQ